MNKLNLGSGEFKLEGFINIDFSEQTKPDLVCNFKKDALPFKNDSCDLIHLLHVLEHIEMKFWNNVFNEIRRVLILEGKLILAYPEFEICSRYFIENHKASRDFWQATLYGRQAYD